MHPNDFDRLAIREVIARQLDAFHRKDGDAALALATTARRRNGNGADFLAAVKNAFPQLVESRDAEFGELFPYQGFWAQQVTVTGPDGAPQDALYVMARTAEGVWRIDGCVLLQSPLAS